MPAALAALPARGAARAARPAAPRVVAAAEDDEGNDTAEGATGKTPLGPDPALLAGRTVARDAADGGLLTARRAVGAAQTVDPAADTPQPETRWTDAEPAQARPAAAHRGEAHDRVPALAGSANRGVAGRGGAGRGVVGRGVEGPVVAGRGGEGPVVADQGGADLGGASEGRGAVPVVGARPVQRVGWSRGRGLAAALALAVAAVSGLATVSLVAWWLHATGAAREPAPASAQDRSAARPPAPRR